jgi:DinB family protein
MNAQLDAAVEKWTSVALTINDTDLEKAWMWKDYDEGIRFAFFRVYEELRTLAACLRDSRIKHGPAFTETHLILGNYHSAFRDLHAALLGIASPDFDRAPSENEWPLRKVLEHIIGADMGFFVLFKNGLKNHRQEGGKLGKITDAFWEQTTGENEASLEALFMGPVENILSHHCNFHARILSELTDITGAELEKPAQFWESEPMLLRFRLYRFDSHMRQHTIQVDKTLTGLNFYPSEVKRLLRMIHAAWADADNVLIGASGFGKELVAQYAESIKNRSDEIVSVLEG